MLREVEIDPARVHFLGRLAYQDYLRLLQVSAAHVYLTVPFVLSWSMLEAMSAGCLVIGSATPPVLEVIEDGVNGVLVDFFSPETIAARVIDVLAHPARYAAIRSAELRKQQRNDQQLVEAFQPVVALAPVYVRPEHSGERKQPQQHRQPASRGAQFTAQLGNVERRDQREQPERGQNLRCRNRPGHRDRNADRQPVGNARKPRAIKTTNC